MRTLTLLLLVFGQLFAQELHIDYDSLIKETESEYKNRIHKLIEQSKQRVSNSDTLVKLLKDASDRRDDESNFLSAAFVKEVINHKIKFEDASNIKIFITEALESYENEIVLNKMDEYEKLKVETYLMIKHHLTYEYPLNSYRADDVWINGGGFK